MGPRKRWLPLCRIIRFLYGVDIKDGKNVGNSYSHYIINDLLRENTAMTEWSARIGALPRTGARDGLFGSRCFGVENLTEGERHLLAIENGVDQFGGNCKIEPVLEAYRLGCEKYGESVMRARMERSAARLCGICSAAVCSRILIWMWRKACGRWDARNFAEPGMSPS